MSGYLVAEYLSRFEDDQCFMCEATSPSHAAQIWAEEEWGANQDYSENFEVYVQNTKTGEQTAVAVTVIPEPTFRGTSLKIAPCCGSLIASWRTKTPCPVCDGMTPDQLAALVKRNDGKPLDQRRSE